MPDNDFEIVNTEGKLTNEDLKNIKQMSQYWQSGKIFLAIILTCGLVATVCIQLFDLFSHWVNK